MPPRVFIHQSCCISHSQANNGEAATPSPCVSRFRSNFEKLTDISQNRTTILLHYNSGVWLDILTFHNSCNKDGAWLDICVFALAQPVLFLRHHVQVLSILHPKFFILPSLQLPSVPAPRCIRPSLDFKILSSASASHPFPATA